MSDSTNFDFAPFDALLACDGPVVIVGQQFLRPAAIADDDIVFPPSYANPSEKKDDSPVYNIDVIDPANPSKNVCVLDSIPSQANRMEPLFGVPTYSTLVPQYSVRLTEDTQPVSILNIGHRIADAVFRGTTLRDEIVSAFKSYAKGNAVQMAKLGPTSLVFGVWDSRGTGVKVPRLINSIIRAFNVTQLKRSAQYSPPIKYEQEGLIPVGLTGKPSDHGLADVPSTHKIGGVQIHGDIRRDFSLNLATLRALKGASADETKDLQRYIFSLSLLALIATPESTLRQGCLLLPKGKTTWKQFLATGDESVWVPENLSISEFAIAAAADFGVVQPQNQPLVFDKNLLKSSIEADAKKKADKKVTDENPLYVIRKLVDALKVSANGKKINEATLKKLTEHLDAITEGPVKVVAESIKSAISCEDAPEEKIKKLKDLIEKAKNAEPATSEGTPSATQESMGGNAQ